jgi:hypothetical protein
MVGEVEIGIGKDARKVGDDGQEVVTLGARAGAGNCETRGEVPLYRSDRWTCGIVRELGTRRGAETVGSMQF